MGRDNFWHHVSESEWRRWVAAGPAGADNGAASVATPAPARASSTGAASAPPDGGAPAASSAPTARAAKRVGNEAARLRRKRAAELGDGAVFDAGDDDVQNGDAQDGAGFVQRTITVEVHTCAYSSCGARVYGAGVGLCDSSGRVVARLCPECAPRQTEAQAQLDAQLQARSAALVDAARAANAQAEFDARRAELVAAAAARGLDDSYGAVCVKCSGPASDHFTIEGMCDSCELEDRMALLSRMRGLSELNAALDDGNLEAAAGVLQSGVFDGVDGFDAPAALLGLGVTAKTDAAAAGLDAQRSATAVVCDKLRAALRWARDVRHGGDWGFPARGCVDALLAKHDWEESASLLDKIERQREQGRRGVLRYHDPSLPPEPDPLDAPADRAQARAWYSLTAAERQLLTSGKSDYKRLNQACWARGLLTFAEQGALSRDGALRLDCDCCGGPAGFDDGAGAQLGAAAG